MKEKTVSADWIHPLGHQFAISALDESNEMPERLKLGMSVKLLMENLLFVMQAI